MTFVRHPKGIIFLAVISDSGRPVDGVAIPGCLWSHTWTVESCGCQGVWFYSGIAYKASVMFPGTTVSAGDKGRCETQTLPLRCLQSSVWGRRVVTHREKSAVEAGWEGCTEHRAEECPLCCDLPERCSLLVTVLSVWRLDLGSLNTIWGPNSAHFLFLSSLYIFKWLGKRIERRRINHNVKIVWNWNFSVQE